MVQPTTRSDPGTSRTVDTLLPINSEGKMSQGMRQTLQGLIDILHCPLCDELFQKPTTLSSCGHSFCEICIDKYNATSSICPVKGCGMPMSIVGGGRGPYRKINPQLAQCVESLQLVCQGLHRAPDNWWMNNNLIIAEAIPLDTDDRDDDLDLDDGGSVSDVENLIDLQ